MDVEAKINELSELVQKQSLLIAASGKQLMELQVKDVKSRMAAMDTKPANIDTDDFVTNDDIVQLVTELQGQLDFLEDRTIKRIFNSHVLPLDPAAPLAPLGNRDGDAAPSVFPKTMGDFDKITGSELVELCEFYDLIVTEASDEMKQLVESDTLTPEDAAKLFGASSQEPQDALQFTKEQIDELFDELARYIGVRARRGAGW